jgi:hypothetical protein
MTLALANAVKVAETFSMTSAQTGETTRKEPALDGSVTLVRLAQHAALFKARNE